MATTPARLCRVQAALYLRLIPWPLLRLWLALLEGYHRARFPDAEPPHVEAARLMGGRWTARRVARGERALAELGLVDVGDVETGVHLALDARAAWMEAQLGHDNVRGGIVVPRRHVRWMLRQLQPSPALAATWVAYVLRSCLAKRACAAWLTWRRFRSGPDFRGCATAGWIARTFGVAEENARRSLQRLVEAQLFRRVETLARVRQSCGTWVVTLSGPVPPGPESPVVTGRERKMHGNVTPPSPTCTRHINTYQGATGPGRFQRGKARQKPRWHQIRQADLRYPRRLLALYESAVEAGAAGGSIADRDAFFSAAARARRVAKRNAPGCLRRLVESPRCRPFPTIEDEDCGQEWLREAEAERQAGLHPGVAVLAGGDPMPVPAGAGGLAGRPDWELASMIGGVLDADGIEADCDRWSLVREDELCQQLLIGWDRDRWDRAVADAARRRGDGPLMDA